MTASADDVNVDDLRRRARRRLVGAIVLALGAAVFVPMLLESDPKPLGEDVAVKIPPVDEGKFVNRLSDKGKSDPAKASPARGDAAKADARERRRAPDRPGEGGPAEERTAPGQTRRRTSPAAKRRRPMRRRRPRRPRRRRNPRRLRRSGPSPKPSRRCWARPRRRRRRPRRPRNRRPRRHPCLRRPRQRPPRRRLRRPRRATPPPDSRCSSPRSPTTRAPTRSRTSSRRPDIPAYTEPLATSKGTLWRVRVGPYPSREAAAAGRDKLKGEGYSGIVAAAR